MKPKIKKFTEYNTENPFMIPINEGKGIPNILKDIIGDVYAKVLEKIDNPTNIISMDFDYNNFNISNLYIKISNRKVKEIYAVSRFGIFTGKSLKSPVIEITLDYNNYNNLDLKRVILHELLHIYEIFNRIKSKSKKDIQWGLNKSLLNLRNKYSDDKFVSDFIYMIYLSLDHEINSRVAETYTILIDLNIDDKDLLLIELRKTSAWRYKEHLHNFTGENTHRLLDFLKELSDSILKKYDVNFNLYTKNDIKYWLRLFNKKSKYFEKKLLKIIDEVSNDVNMFNTSYVDVDNTKDLSERYITKYNSMLESKSISYKNDRNY